MIDLILTIFIPLSLILLGLFVGRWVESRHLHRLTQRELALRDMVVCNLKTIPRSLWTSQAFLVVGEAVIATDYFKIFVGGIRNLFGGEMRGYKTLMDRARREATLRMLEEARRSGARFVWNVRYETVMITEQKNNPGGVELMAYGTALKMP
jgi:uncharacterized protein YbjQ (UPF0145 family)